MQEFEAWCSVRNKKIEVALDRALAYTERLVQEKEKLAKYRKEILDNEREFQRKLREMNHLRAELQGISLENQKYIKEIGAAAEGGDEEATSKRLSNPEEVDHIREIGNELGLGF